MARKQIAKPDNDPASFKKSIVEGVQRLWDAHGAGAIDFAEQSDKKKVTISFPVEIDLSKSTPITEVGIGFSQRVTDSVKFTLEDPKQGTFTELIESKPPEKGPNRGESEEPRDGKEEPKKRRGKNNPENN